MHNNKNGQPATRLEPFDLEGIPDGARHATLRQPFRLRPADFHAFAPALPARAEGPAQACAPPRTSASAPQDSAAQP